MKTIQLVLVSLLLAQLALAQNIRKIDTKRSEVKWKGSSLVYFHNHYGTVDISSGILTTENGRLSGGTVSLDMNTIRNTDGDYNKGLVEHLKDPDFFDVANHKTAVLDITRVSFHGNDRLECEGELTIKGITNSIRFYAEVNAGPTGVYYTSRLKIDRTRWDIKYQSKSFFDDLGDRALSDVIEFEVLLATQ